MTARASVSLPAGGLGARQEGRKKQAWGLTSADALGGWASHEVK